MQRIALVGATVSRTSKPQISFADWELREQRQVLDPLLLRMADFLDEHETAIEPVRRDLERSLKKPQTGRSGLTPAQVLRSLVLMRIKNWDYRELRDRITDGYSLRIFTEFYSQQVPGHDAFQRSFSQLTPTTLKAVNELVVQAAVDLGLEDGSKLRVDTTVVQTNIHHPTDNTLLWDAIRVITRLIGYLLAALEMGDFKGFPKRTLAARRRMLEIHRMTSRQREAQLTKVYRALIAIAEEVIGGARRVLEETKKLRGNNTNANRRIRKLREAIKHYCKLGDRVIDQARRRVLDGEQVPTAEKIYSIFEPHTDLIKRGKVLHPVEFGHKVFIAESARGLITQYEVLDGNPNDEHQVAASLKRHRSKFGRAPELYSSDRGFFNEGNEKACRRAGVKVVSMPQRGGYRTAKREAYEATSEFKKGQSFRAGIEGRISVLFRGRGMKRCLAQGRDSFEVWVGAAVLANNLLKIATLLREREQKRKRAA